MNQHKRSEANKKLKERSDKTMDENTVKVLELLKSKSEFEESKNGNKGHVIWSNDFYKLSQDIVILLNKHIVTNF